MTDRSAHSDSDALVRMARMARAGEGPAALNAASLIATRESTHGNFVENCRITQNIKRSMRDSPNWANDMSSMHREALDMIAHKIGRILAGDPKHRDHWADIAGYAQLVADRGTA